jgi:hypothetical protein
MKFVSAAVTRKIARQSLVISKNSPTLLFGAGVVGVVGSTVLACKATLKLEETLYDGQMKLKEVKNHKHENYSDKDRERDVVVVHIKTVANVVKLYAPAIVVGGISIGALTKSHNILSRRNAALTAAYGVLEKGFAEYRQRVVEKYGEEEDRNFRYGSQKVEIVNEETGKKKNAVRVTDGEPSIYARFFDPLCRSWSRNHEYNLAFLRCQQSYVNDLLLARGHVFLNEVYDQLGLTRTKAGSVVGWVITGDGTDNYIDFGIWKGDDQNAIDFVNGREGAILLDFNVDGIIFDKIDTPTEAVSWQLSE